MGLSDLTGQSERYQFLYAKVGRDVSELASAPAATGARAQVALRIHIRAGSHFITAGSARMVQRPGVEAKLGAVRHTPLMLRRGSCAEMRSANPQRDPVPVPSDDER